MLSAPYHSPTLAYSKREYDISEFLGSNLWSHIGEGLTNVRIPEPAEKIESMTQTESNYVRIDGEGDKETITLLEDAFITADNISTFKFMFDGARDITESVKKNETETSSQISTHAGRTGYAPCKCIYPDNTSSTTMVFTNVVIQYVKTMAKETSKYGKGYLFVGIPELYINEMQKQAKTNSSRTIKPKPKNERLSGYVWATCSTEKLSPSNVNVTIDDGDKIRKVAVSLIDILKEMKQNLLCNVTLSINASITSPTLSQGLDLIGGTFYFTFKMLAVDILSETNIKSPELELLEKQAKEEREDSALNIATSKIAKLAISRLGV